MSYNNNIKEIHGSSLIKTLVKEESTESVPKLYLSPDDPESRFIPNVPKSALHFGQLKLLLSEIAVLTRFVIDSADKYYIIYAGAAPYRHGKILLDLFPGIHMLLIDPAEFDASLIKMSLEKDKYDIKIVNSLFTDEIIGTIIKEIPADKIIFFSDIRHNPIEEDIDRDMRLQEKWVRQIKPLISCLKFRLPWDGKTEYSYLSGEIMLQVYAPVSSTETRLIVTDPDSHAVWNPRKYEDQMFNYNFGARLQYHKWSDKYNDIIKKTKGMDHCGDCSLFIKIIADYMAKTKMKEIDLTAVILNSIKISAAPTMNLFTLWLVDNSKSIARKLHEMIEKIRPLVMEKSEYNLPIRKEISNFIKAFSRYHN